MPTKPSLGAEAILSVVVVWGGLFATACDSSTERGGTSSSAALPHGDEEGDAGGGVGDAQQNDAGSDNTASRPEQSTATETASGETTDSSPVEDGANADADLPETTEIEPNDDSAPIDEDVDAATLPNSDESISAEPTTPNDRTPASCEFEVALELSPQIPTVGIVSWSVNQEVDSARVESRREGAPQVLSAPVDMSTAPDFRTVVLGMKANEEYLLSVEVTTNGRTCRSQDYSLSTGQLPSRLPRIDVELGNIETAQEGFIVATDGPTGNFMATTGEVFIIDTDGDFVWWWLGPANGTRARLDWEGSVMWAVGWNPSGVGGGGMQRVSLDGLDVDDEIPELAAADADFVVTPGGGVVALAKTEECNAVIERRADGTVSTIVDTVAQLYAPDGECGAASLSYLADTDTFVLGDRISKTFVHFDRDGNVLWQVGGSPPAPDTPFFELQTSAGFGHHLIDGSTLLFINNEAPGLVYEYELDVETETANLLWQYDQEVVGATLGDVQRLTNGNTFITNSAAGELVEVNPNGELVRRFSTYYLGYAQFRESLYGPPPK